MELHSGQICTYYMKMGNISSKNTTLSYEFTISSKMTKYQQYKELHSESHLKPNKSVSNCLEDKLWQANRRTSRRLNQVPLWWHFIMKSCYGSGIKLCMACLPCKKWSWLSKLFLLTVLLFLFLRVKPISKTT